MPRNKVGSSNGGVIGKTNKSSFGKDKVTSTTSTGSSTVTTQPGTRLARVLVDAGGGSGGTNQGGGGGAGGVVEVSCVPVSGNTGYPVVVGGGASGASPLMLVVVQAQIQQVFV